MTVMPTMREYDSPSFLLLGKLLAAHDFSALGIRCSD